MPIHKQQADPTKMSVMVDTTIMTQEEKELWLCVSNLNYILNAERGVRSFRLNDIVYFDYAVKKMSENTDILNRHVFDDCREFIMKNLPKGNDG